MPRLIDYIHGLGLQFGVYMAAGNQTCNPGGRPYHIPGSLGRYKEDAMTLAYWWDLMFGVLKNNFFAVCVCVCVTVCVCTCV